MDYIVTPASAALAAIRREINALLPSQQQLTAEDMPGLVQAIERAGHVIVHQELLAQVFNGKAEGTTRQSSAGSQEALPPWPADFP
jgi:hypothetical protein